MISIHRYDTPEVGFSSYTPPSAPPPVTGSVWGAAFRQENDVLNLMEFLNREQFAADPNFAFWKRAQGNPLWQNNINAFSAVKSDAEWDYIEQRLLREQKDRERIAAGGWAGIGAAMVAGVVSPTILVPFAGAIRAPTVGMAGVRAAGLTAAIAAGQEGVLQANQYTRTAEESAIAIGASAVLGGLLGAAARYMTPDDALRLGSGMASGNPTRAIQPLLPPPSVGSRGAGLSAQVTPLEEVEPAVRTFVDPRGLQDGVITKPLRWLGAERAANFVSGAWLGPITRGITSPLQTVRAVTGQFSTAGLRTQAQAAGEVIAPEGSLEDLIKQHTGRYFLTAHEVEGMFHNWFVDAGSGPKIASYFPTRSFKDFSEQVMDGVWQISRGQKPNNPYIAQAAQKYYDDVFKRMAEEAKFAGLQPFGRLSPEYAVRVLSQRLSPLAARSEGKAVREILEFNAREVLAEGKLKQEKMSKDGFAAKILAEQFPEYAAKLDKRKKQATLADLDDETLDDIARRIADALYEKHTGGSLQRHDILSILEEINEGEAKFLYIDPTRKWDNGRTWGEFLDRDIDRVAKSVTRSLASDVEIWRRFKVNFRGQAAFKVREHEKVPFVTELREEIKLREDQIAARFDAGVQKATVNGKISPKALAKLEDQRTKALRKLAEAEKQFEKDLEVLFGRLRHTWGEPLDPESFGHTWGRRALQLNTMRLMGSVVVSSIPDMARPVLKYGFMTTMRDGLIPLLTDMKRFRMSVREGRYSGEMLDVLNHSRSQGMFDNFEEMQYRNPIDRVMQYGTNKIGLVALFDYWTTGMKQLSGAVLQSQMARAFDAASAGRKLSKREKQLLTDLNISEADAEAMGRLIKNGGGERMPSGVWLPNTEDWVALLPEDLPRIDRRARELFEEAEVRRAEKAAAAKEEYTPRVLDEKKLASSSFAKEAKKEILRERSRLQRVYRGAVSKGVADTIVTPGLERPNWVDATGFGRLIAQFRSYTLSSNFKVLQAASQDVAAGNMAPLMVGVPFSLALGLLSYYTWAQTAGGRARERFEAELDRAINGDDEAMGRLADEAITRSGLLGVFSEIQKVAERTPALAPYSTFAGTPTTRSPFLNPAVEALGPWLGLVEGVGRVAVTADDPTSETFRTGKQLMPYQNHFLLRRYFDSVNESIMDSMGMDYR